MLYPRARALSERRVPITGKRYELFTFKVYVYQKILYYRLSSLDGAHIEEETCQFAMGQSPQVRNLEKKKTCWKKGEGLTICS